MANMKLSTLGFLLALAFAAWLFVSAPGSNTADPVTYSLNEGHNTAVYKEARADLNSFGGKSVYLDVVKPGSECNASDKAIACAVIGQPNIYLDSNIMSMNMKLKSVVAHEYVHTLTSATEAAWLKKNLHVKGIESVEVIADCGVSYFVNPNSPDYMLSYMVHGCTPTETRLSGEVINNQPLH